MKKLILMVSLGIGLLYSCKDTNNEALDLEKERQASIDSMKMEIEKQRIIDSIQLANAQRAESKKEVVVVNQAAPAKKKWSGAAKGAVIGAGVGAVTGAAVSKNKAEGAIIGGIAGAGVGAGTGAIVDESKKKE